MSVFISALYQALCRQQCPRLCLGQLSTFGLDIWADMKTQNSCVIISIATCIEDKCESNDIMNCF